jgi:hypothetical protein
MIWPKRPAAYCKLGLQADDIGGSYAAMMRRSSPVRSTHVRPAQKRGESLGAPT